ncbi:Electron transfer flavoprotein domain [Raoultella ornithinolytica]|nr:Electron transfer flavoprotein domain [Raoultella ornithinolytica]
MATLLLVEHDNNQLNAVTKNAVSAARELGGEVTLLVAGETAARWRNRLRALPGWRKCCSLTIAPLNISWPKTSPR